MARVSLGGAALVFGKVGDRLLACAPGVTKQLSRAVHHQNQLSKQFNGFNKHPSHVMFHGHIEKQNERAAASRL